VPSLETSVAARIRHLLQRRDNLTSESRKHVCKGTSVSKWNERVN